MSDPNPPQYPSYPTGGEQPPAYGYPPQQPYYAGQPGPTVPYAFWGARLGAYLLDGLIGVAVAIIPFVIGGIIPASRQQAPLTSVVMTRWTVEIRSVTCSWASAI
ncbi:MAG: hypothetical protein H7288_00110 [Kineosporiaceae bacterium]|nr:hypothetical protein [Aeromicrobium sp.]